MIEGYTILLFERAGLTPIRGDSMVYVDMESVAGGSHRVSVRRRSDGAIEYCLDGTLMPLDTFDAFCRVFLIFRGCCA